jgi:hypothetical protein
MAIGLFASAQAPAAFRPGGGGFHGGGMFHGGAMPAFHANRFHSFADRAFAGGRRHAFDFDRDRGFRHRHRHFFFAGGPFFAYDYGYPYDCSPYWNGYRLVYPYGYGYACGSLGYGAGY